MACAPGRGLLCRRQNDSVLTIPKWSSEECRLRSGLSLAWRPATVSMWQPQRAHGRPRIGRPRRASPMPATSALVIGGSLAGMCAARVLSDVFDKVTIIERDAYPSAPDFR